MTDAEKPDAAPPGESPSSPENRPTATAPGSPDAPPPGVPGRRRRALLLIGVIAALTCVLCGLVYTRTLRLGIPGEWVWQYKPTPGAGLLAELGLPLALFFAFLVSVWLFARIGMLRSWDRELVAVAVVVVLGFAFQVASASIWGGLGQDVFAIQQESVGGYYNLSLEIDSPVAFLEGYPRLIATRPDKHGPVGHLNTHPPGNTMYFYLLRRFFESAPELAEQVTALETSMVKDTFDYLIEKPNQLVLRPAERATIYVGALLARLLAVLVAVPIYLLGRSVLGKRRALWAAALGLCIPAVIVFLPGFDAFYGTLAMTVAALMVGALVRRSVPLALLAGLALYLGMFFTPAMVVVVVLVLVWYGLARWSDWGKDKLARAQGRPRLAAVVAAGLLGFGVLLAFLWTFLKFDAVATWYQCMVSNARFNEVFQRSYLPWVLYNPVDFLMFLGTGVSVLLVLGVAWTVGRLKAWRRWDPVTLGLGVFVAGLLLLDLSGANSGETARLWMFLMPGAVMLSLPVLERFEPLEERVILVVLFLQVVQAFVFKLSLNVLFMTTA